jgi:hypothetical protein
MIDIQNEDLITLIQAARQQPPGRRGRPVHVSTIVRWADRGIRGVRLETVRIGGRRLTSRQALQRFADRLTGADSEPVRPRAEARKAHRIAEARLDELGVK